MTRLFGTNGVRGLVGSTMTCDLALRLGQATGSWLAPGAQIGVGRDARDSGPMLQAAFMAGVLSTGVHVVDLGVAPSPAFQLYVRDRGLAAGAVVTASHNPPEWNGIKLVAPDGTETERSQEEEVERILASGAFRASDWRTVGRLSQDDGAARHYVDAVVAQVDADAIRAARLKVVVDPGGGAGCQTSPMLLRALGVEAVELSCTFDGAFRDRPSEPTEKNAAACMAAVREHGAHLGVLHDGDADRAIFIDENGNYVWGDQSLALAALHELPRHPIKLMCTAVSSSTCVADAARMAGGSVEWTPVGSPIVARAMLFRGAPFGGEDNGGLMFARHQVCRDGLMALAFMLELLATTGRSFSDLVGDVPRYHLEKRKMEVSEGAKQALLEALQGEAKGLDGALEVDGRDGVKVYFAEGWALVRPSGTEPIFRIQAEAADAGAAKALADRMEGLLASLRKRVHA